jgi:hypothetical protein
MTFPNETYPADPDLPTVSDEMVVSEDLYDVIATYIAAVSADLADISDESGNIDISTGIKWGGSLIIDLSGGCPSIASMNIPSVLTVMGTLTDTPTIAISGDMDIGEYLDIDGDLSIPSGSIDVDYIDRNKHTFSPTAAPASPSENQARIWFSNGTGSGDAGDFCILITEDGTTKFATLADYSAL